eukprot:800847-Amorphochlora_amoeboformis.AAC.1
MQTQTKTNPNPTSCFKGKLRDIRLWGPPRTQEQIKATMDTAQLKEGKGEEVRKEILGRGVEGKI